MFDGSTIDDGGGRGPGDEADAGREADRQLRRIARRRAGLEAEEARWLLVARRANVHLGFGFATFAEYVERVLGHGPRAGADRLRVAEALAALPSTAAALATGAVAYSAVRELTRVATPATEAAWLAAAHGRTAREIEAAVAGHRPGDQPDDPTAPDLRPRVLRFEVTPETYALVRAAERRLAADVGHPLSDDEVVAALARAALAPTEPGPAAHVGQRPAHVGRANQPHYQIALTLCAACRRGWHDGAGPPVEVGPGAIATAGCDAQVLGRVDGAGPARATRTIPPATRRQVLRRDHGQCVVPGCRAARWIDVHHLHPRAGGGGHAAHNLAACCAGHHRAIHDGRLVITGEPGRLQFWHGDGRRWGSAPTPGALDPPGPGPTRPPSVATAIRSALRNLGFTAAEATAAATRAIADVGADGPLATLLGAALRACRR